MAATVIVELPGTSTTEINKKLNELREKTGAVTLGRVLTLVIVPDSEAVLEESIAAANAASHEHPSRVIVVTTGDADASDARLDAQLRVGGDTRSPPRSWCFGCRAHWPDTTAASSYRSCCRISPWWRGGRTSLRPFRRRIPWAS